MKPNMPEFAVFMSLLENKTTTILKLAVDIVNLGLYVSHDHLQWLLLEMTEFPLKWSDLA